MNKELLSNMLILIGVIGLIIIYFGTMFLAGLACGMGNGTNCKLNPIMPFILLFDDDLFPMYQILFFAFVYSTYKGIKISQEIKSDKEN